MARPQSLVLISDESLASLNREEQLDHREDQVHQRQEEQDQRDEELNERAQALAEIHQDLATRSQWVTDRERHLAHIVADWTGDSLAEGQSLADFVGQIDWAMLPPPSTFEVPHPEADFSDEDEDEDPWTWPSAALVAGNAVSGTPPQDPATTPTARPDLAIPDINARIRTQPLKRKRSSDGENINSESQTDRQPSPKKTKVVIDLTGDD